MLQRRFAYHAECNSCPQTVNRHAAQREQDNKCRMQDDMMLVVLVRCTAQAVAIEDRSQRCA
jgi:hypothetical protein